MKNSMYFTVPNGKMRYAEFGWIKSISPINVAGTVRYHRIYVTNVVYPDTGEIAEIAMLVLANPNCSVTYCGKRYKFDNLNKLCMVVENENNLAALESL